MKLKSEQVKELNKTKADIARLQREKDELKGTIEAEQSEKFNNQLALEKEKFNSEKSEQVKELNKIKTLKILNNNYKTIKICPLNF